MTGERWPFHILDVFTDRPLAGNQLAVFEAASDIPECVLQPLAREIDFSETVFLYPSSEETDARMRIFTPENEVPFAGHPTLGTAVVVSRSLGKRDVALETAKGPVPVHLQRGPGPLARGTMRQPIPSIAAYPHADTFLSALRVGRSQLPVALYDNGIPHLYVVLERPEDVAALQPDLQALARLARETGNRIVGFNVFAGAGTEWKTRMLAPADGVPEDPATGSAAGPLALPLARHGLVPWGAELRISQGAEIGRPSTLFARAVGNAARVEAIEVSGDAVLVGGGWFDANLLRGPIAESSGAAP